MSARCITSTSIGVDVTSDWISLSAGWDWSSSLPLMSSFTRREMVSCKSVILAWRSMEISSPGASGRAKKSAASSWSLIRALEISSHSSPDETDMFEECAKENTHIVIRFSKSVQVTHLDYAWAKMSGGHVRFNIPHICLATASSVQESNIIIRRIVDYISNTAPCMFGSNSQNGFPCYQLHRPCWLVWHGLY